MAQDKTNVMRLLDQKKVSYIPHHYAAPDGAVDGVTVAGLIGRDPALVFKTLVTRGASKANYVFVIPVTGELDLKAAARAAGEKSIEMIRQAELLPLTGYIHGGCSPLGMKKQLRTFLDESARKDRRPGGTRPRRPGRAGPGPVRTGGEMICLAQSFWDPEGFFRMSRTRLLTCSMAAA